ncbi:MAG: DEAD/DEAH box helicase [Candidatus Aureabacteria bacterium]|nr:DEAD/DEAH box helicase [Candidatus Auribacterota bacterium]
MSPVSHPTTGHKFNLPEGILKVLADEKILSLYPPQEEALSSGVLEGKNLVLAIPTAAGKTLVAEICMVKAILEGRGRCLYVVPLRALASEKYEEFKRRYGPLGISVGIATGEYDMPGARLGRFDIVIATSEKVDSLLRMHTRWLSEGLAVAVLEEIHYIHDPSRGPTLEIIAARLRQVNLRLQILALSATITNARELASWLDAALVCSDWRPVPLAEGVYDGSTITYADLSTRSLPGSARDPLVALVRDTITEGGQVIVFVNARRSTIAVARTLAGHLKGSLSPGDKKALGELAGAARGVLAEPTHLCEELASVISGGAAFHHAGLHHEQRRLIEDAFRANRIKVICATPTLAAGVNLPARRVIIRDWHRYEFGRGSRPIPVFEYKQFAGRAGRPGYDTEGEALLIAKKAGDKEFLFDHYLRAAAEPLRSQLGTGGALGAHLLAAIASGYAASRDEIMSFLQLTFFAVQGDVEELDWLVDRILLSLLEDDLISIGDGEGADSESISRAALSPTPLGAIVSRLYLEPRSGVILRDGILAARDNVPIDYALLHLICCCPDMDVVSPGKGDLEALRSEAIARRQDFLVRYPGESDPDLQYRFLEALLTAQFLGEWIRERPEDALCEEFGIGPGDLRRIIEGADWLLHSAGQVGRLIEKAALLPVLDQLRLRTMYGIKEELLDLVSLKGIGRMRARSLFRKGYRALDDIRGATEKSLSDVPGIGEQLAASIKKQAARPRA